MLHSKANPELHELDKQKWRDVCRERYQKRKHGEAMPGLTRAEAQELIDLQPHQVLLLLRIATTTKVAIRIHMCLRCFAR